MRRWYSAWMLTILLVSGQARALDGYSSSSLALDGSLCFITPDGEKLNIVSASSGEGPCAATYGEMDTAAGTGMLWVWDKVFGSSDMGAELTLFGEGQHSWTYVGSDSYGNPKTYTYTFTVDPGQVGGGMLFSWTTGGLPYSFGVVNVWDVGTGCAQYPWDLACQTYSSTDWDGDGVLGGLIQDDSFIGVNVSFDFYASPVPLPAAVWLFAGGLAGLAGAARWRGRA